MTMNPKLFGPFSYEIHKDAHRRDLDSKVIITSHNSKPGLGKTTLAIKIARALDPNGWTAEEKAYMDAYGYIEAYDKYEPGSVLLFDEIEAEADNRRSVTNKNVDLSHAWATKRYRNMISICTLPSVSMLDKRFLEFSDFRVNVLKRGVAKVFKIEVDDFSGKIWQDPMDGLIRYNDLPEDDEDYQLLKKMKHERTQLNRKMIPKEDYDKDVKKAREKAKMECRNVWLKYLNNGEDYNPYDLAKFDIVDISRKRIQQITSD